MDKHFILTHGRSGSNFLVNTLNKHPNLVNYGEVLGEWTIPYKVFPLYRTFGKRWPNFIDSLYTSTFLYYLSQLFSAYSHIKNGAKINFKRKANIESIGIKDFVFLLNKRNATSYLQERDDIKVIYLTRRNHLNRYLSLHNMSTRGIVKTEKINLEKIKYHINTADLLEKIHIYREEERIGDKIISELPPQRYITIDYEEYFSNGESIDSFHAAIFNFLNVDNINIKSAQKKILSTNISDHIINYKEVMIALTESGLEEYL